jgi:D-arabinose 1-dehydrogenase-like Zn-dependent alcohol dehydrogenase
MKRIKIIGSQQNGREYLYEALAFAASGKVRVVTETYRLDEIRKAYERREGAGEVPRGRDDVTRRAAVRTASRPLDGSTC